VGVLAVPCFTGNVSKYLACSGYPQLQYGSFLTLKLACPAMFDARSQLLAAGNYGLAGAKPFPAALRKFCA
jgi:hypothetical protein